MKGCCLIKVIEINSFEKLAPYKQQWEDILSKSATNVVFLTYEYCLSWWQAYGGKYQLMVLLAFDDGQLVGISPLIISSGNKKIVRIIGDNQSDYMDFIIAAEHEQVLKAFYDYLWFNRDRWNVIRFRQIPVLSPLVRVSRKILAEKDQAFSIRNGHACLALGIAGNEKEVQDKVNKQRTLKTAIKKLEENGKLIYEHVTDFEKACEYLDKYFQQHISRWDNTATLSTYYNEEPRNFYRQLIENLIPKGWLHFAHLSLNDDPIAINVSFLYNKSLAVHRSSYNPWYYKHSPGRLIFRYATQYCLDNKLKDFDLLAGLETYKGYLVTESRLTREVHIFKSRTSKFLDDLKSKFRKSFLFAPLFQDSKIWEARMRLRKFLKFYGKYGLFKYVLSKIFSPVFEFNLVDIYRWTGEEIPDIKARCDIAIRQGSRDDLHLIGGFYGCVPEAAYMMEVEEKFNHDAVPYFAINGKTLVHISWVAFKDHYLDEAWSRLNLGQDSAYIWHCKTCFTFKGKNIYPCVLQHVIKELKEKDIKKIYIGVKPSNTASINGIRKAGFAFHKRISAFKLFGIKAGKNKISF